MPNLNELELVHEFELEDEFKHDFFKVWHEVRFMVKHEVNLKNLIKIKKWSKIKTNPIYPRDAHISFLVLRKFASLTISPHCCKPWPL